MDSRQSDAPQDDAKLLITVEEAARRLSIGRSHMYEQLQRGHLRSVKIGRSRRILLRDLDAFLESLTDLPEARPDVGERSSRAVKEQLPRRSGRR